LENFYTDQYGRVWGNKAISDTTIVTASNNEITISSGVHNHTFNVPVGTYSSMYVTSTSELVVAIKSTLQSNSYPIEVHFGGNHKDTKFNSLVFNMTDGSTIDNISGSFFDAFFK
jgi:hypothetical protein